MASSALPQGFSPLQQRPTGDTDGSSIGHDAPELVRSASTTSTKVDPTLSRGGTLKKRTSLRKRGSLSRRSSRRSLRAGGISPYGDGDNDDDFNNVFNLPIPTTGNPTDVLADRFQAWRRLLKDIITYLAEVKASYEHRSKSLIKVSNVINNTHTPNIFPTSGGLGDAIDILRNYHKIALAEANKANNIEDDVITQLNGLRSDLSQKIKEIKSLSGDFKNSVDKEKDATRKAVAAYEAALAAADVDPSNASGKNDPFIVRLAVDRQVERQIEEENYLHRAYLNLEGSGRELEAIVVGEIQKAYNALAGILRRDADNSTNTIENLRAGPITMPRDHEWSSFVEKSPQFVSPSVPLRKLENIYYPGKYNASAAEIRAGNLERKSKYLKSYTPGWYVLSPTHLHEFKSPDHIESQTPVMSLFLLDQKLGSRSQPGASSHKFSLKGRQAGGMHRGHSWVFRAESYETMLAWYEDIQSLTEKTGEDKAIFIRKHARTVSAGSYTAPSMSSDGLVDDEADSVPFSGQPEGSSLVVEPPPKRPEPGGRFPSDLSNTERRLQRPQSSGSSTFDNTNSELAAAHDTPVRAVSSSTRDGIEATDYFGPNPGKAAPAQDKNVTDRNLAVTPTQGSTIPAQSSTRSTPAKGQAVPEDHGVAMMAGALAGRDEKSSQNLNSEHEVSADPIPTPVTHADSAGLPGDSREVNVASTTLQGSEAIVSPLKSHNTSENPNDHANAAKNPATLSVTQTPTEIQSTMSRSAAMSESTLASSIMSPVDGRDAEPTGRVIPALRHPTTMSAKDLHVPGEFTTRES